MEQLTWQDITFYRSLISVLNKIESAETQLQKHLYTTDGLLLQGQNERRRSYK
jgi:hypothetical protein